MWFSLKCVRVGSATWGLLTRSFLPDALSHPTSLILVFVAPTTPRLPQKKCRETEQKIPRESLRSPVSWPINAFWVLDADPLCMKPSSSVCPLQG